MSQSERGKLRKNRKPFTQETSPFSNGIGDLKLAILAINSLSSLARRDPLLSLSNHNLSLG